MFPASFFLFKSPIGFALLGGTANGSFEEDFFDGDGDIVNELESPPPTEFDDLCIPYIGLVFLLFRGDELF